MQCNIRQKELCYGFQSTVGDLGSEITSGHGILTIQVDQSLYGMMNFGILRKCFEKFYGIFKFK